MSIRTKIGIILTIAVIGFCMAQYLAQHYVLLPGFLSLEKNEALKDLHRVEAAIQNEISQVDSICGDWSSWDDMYTFAKSYSEDFVSSNLVFSAFSSNNLNLIFICDTFGRVIWGSAYDIAAQNPIDLAMFPPDRFPENHPLFEGISSPGSIRFIKNGILMTEKGPLIISMRPILTSNDGGPSRGILIMGRFFDDAMIHRLAGQTQVEFTAASISDAQKKPATSAALHRISRQEPHWIDEADADWMKVYSQYPDINDQPALLLTITTPRNIAHKGYETIRLAVYSLLMAGLGILLMVLFSLKQTVLTPLARLTRHALSIRQSGDYSKRLSIKSKDEIGILSAEFDNMLAYIEKTSRALEETNAQLQKDIEIRLQVTEALKESEERFKAMVDQAVDAVFLNNRNGRIRMVNRVACSQLGYDTQELLQMRIFDIDPDFVNRKEKNLLCDQPASQTPVIFEGKHFRKDGSSYPVEVSVSPIQYKGEDLFLSIARDITRRKQMETHLRYADKMDTLRTLTAGIAHNFNNILTVIFGNAGLAKQSVSEDSPAYTLIQKIEKASMRAREIVWQLINFSNPSSDYMAPFPIHQVIGDIVEKLEASKPENICVKKYIQPDCLPVLGNASHFQQVMTNLWENALDAIPESGGNIEIRLENITLAAISPDMNPEFKPGNYVRITVIDNGRGIDPECVKSIFDPYFTTKDFSYGAGMGLSIVQGIVKSNGGSVSVKSKPGEGTHITLLFPGVETA
jgi:PAS domain S-box-containing protein